MTVRETANMPTPLPDLQTDYLDLAERVLLLFATP